MITEKALDEYWAEKVKTRDRNKCVICGKTTYLNAHHIYSRSNRSTRWKLINGITLCSGHHTLNSTFSAHKTPQDFSEFIEKYLGEDRLDELRALAHSAEKRDRDILKEILDEDFNQEWDRLNC